MQNPRLANRYAKSLLDLAVEKNQLSTVCADMKYLSAICKSSREFVNLLKSPIIKADKKASIINAVTENKVSEITSKFNALLVNKNRESDLPEITEAFIEQYNALNGIHRVKLTTATTISDDVKNNIETKIKTAHGFETVELETVVNENLIGGFVLEFNNNLVDASIARDLREIKKQFEKNIYVPEMH